jgi:hypothetical protein
MVLLAVGWSDQRQLETRRDWLRGEVDWMLWLNWRVRPDQSAGFDDTA